MDCCNGVFCLVEADHLDFALSGLHQGDNLAWSLHKRLAEAVELDLSSRVDYLDHGTSLSIEQHPIIEGTVPSAISPEDGYVFGINLRED